MSLKTELQLMLDTYSEDYRARDIEACLAFFDQECCFLTPRGVLQGKAQLGELHARWLAENRVDREMQVQQIASMGDHVYAIWRFRDRIAAPATGQGETCEGTALGIIRLDPAQDLQHAPKVVQRHGVNGDSVADAEALEV